MKLVEVLGDRFVNGADDTVAYEGPIAGTRGKLNVAETILSIAAAQDALERQAEPGSRVGVLSNHQVETYVSVLSCITSNRTFIPLNPKFPESRLDSVLTLGAVDVILTDEKSAGIAARVAERPPRRRHVSHSQCLARPRPRRCRTTPQFMATPPCSIDRRSAMPSPTSCSPRGPPVFRRESPFRMGTFRVT